jgi:energy-converting hydrogenase Eha subunit F
VITITVTVQFSKILTMVMNSSKVTFICAIHIAVVLLCSYIACLILQGKMLYPGADLRNDSVAC